MALLRDQFNQVTLAPGATAYTSWSYTDGGDHGPQYVSASFQGAEDNYGTATTVQTSVIASYDNSHGYYWPSAIGYASQIRNDGDRPIIIKVNIGNFQ